MEANMRNTSLGGNACSGDILHDSEILDYVEYTSLMINMSRHCNLACELCYVDKKIPFNELDDDEMYRFVARYMLYIKENFGVDLYVCLCGHGELFTRPSMPEFINRLSASSIRQISLTTNGTIDRLDEIDNFNKLYFEVSLDMPMSFCEWNRGTGTFDKICSFIRHAHSRGSQGVSVQSILTRKNYKEALDQGVDFAMNEMGATSVNLIPLYSSSVTHRGMFYVGKYNNDELCLGPEEMEEIRQHHHSNCVFDTNSYFPRYLTLYGNGKVYNCSDSAVEIGSHNEDMSFLFKNLVASKHCGFCKSQPS